MRTDAEANHARIIEAATWHFREDGDRAAMADIARRSGVGIGTLYRHFPDRAALAEAVYRNVVQEVVAEAQSITRRGDGLNALEQWVGTYVPAYRMKQGMLGVLRPIFDHQPGLARGAHARVQAALTGLLERAQTDGSARGDITGEGVLHLIDGIVLGAPAEKEQDDALIDVVIRGLRATR